MSWLTADNLRKAALALTVLLGVQVLYSGARLALLSPPEPVTPVPSSLSPALLELPDAAVASSELVDRPLYWKGRKKRVAQAAPQQRKAKTEQGPDELDQVALLGVFNGGDNPGIIVKFKNERQRVVVGQRVAGWTLSMLSSEGAIFEKGVESRTVELAHAYPRNVTRPGVERRAESAEEPAAAPGEGADNNAQNSAGNQAPGQVP